MDVGRVREGSGVDVVGQRDRIGGLDEAERLGRRQSEVLLERLAIGEHQILDRRHLRSLGLHRQRVGAGSDTVELVGTGILDRHPIKVVVGVVDRDRGFIQGISGRYGHGSRDRGSGHDGTGQRQEQQRASDRQTSGDGSQT